jgi:hypothetical protein
VGFQDSQGNNNQRTRLSSDHNPHSKYPRPRFQLLQTRPLRQHNQSLAHVEISLFANLAAHSGDHTPVVDLVALLLLHHVLHIPLAQLPHYYILTIL